MHKISPPETVQAATVILTREYAGKLQVYLPKRKDIIIDPEDPAASVLPVGEPFSRIWYDCGLWKPVGIGKTK